MRGPVATQANTPTPNSRPGRDIHRRFTLETDYPCETGYPFENSRQIGNTTQFENGMVFNFE